MSKYAIVHCYGTTDRYYVEPSNEQKCLFEGTYEECEKFIEILNQNKDELYIIPMYSDTISNRLILFSDLPT